MDLKDFDAVFPEIVQVLTLENCELDSQEAMDWLKQVLEYNVPFGKKTRGLMTVQTFKFFASKEDLTKENFHMAAILGWCVELLQAFYLITDDVIDQSETRRGKLCWYKNKTVGLQAIVDALSIENGMYTLLQRYFKTKPYYCNLMELFTEVSRKSIIGETLDIISSAKEGKINFDHYTKSRLNAIAKYKTAFYTFFLPVALGMHMAGCCESKIEKTKPVLISLGQLFQVQDDYIDCYGDPEITGKTGTDIQKGKCTWVIVTALELASTNQKEILMENYGHDEKDKMSKVIAVYNELNLPEVYEDYESKCYEDILKMIDNLKDGISVTIFHDFLTNMYRRKK